MASSVWAIDNEYNPLIPSGFQDYDAHYLNGSSGTAVTPDLSAYALNRDTVTPTIQVPSIGQYNADHSILLAVQASTSTQVNYQPQINALGISTGTIYVALQSTGAALSTEITNRIKGDNALGVSTGTIYIAIQSTGAALSSLTTTVNAMGVSTGTLATLGTAQTITGAKTFSGAMTITSSMTLQNNVFQSCISTSCIGGTQVQFIERSSTGTVTVAGSGTVTITPNCSSVFYATVSPYSIIASTSVYISAMNGTSFTVSNKSATACPFGWEAHCKP